MDTRKTRPLPRLFLPVSHGKPARDRSAEWTFIQEVKPYANDLIVSEERVTYMQDLSVKRGIQRHKVPYDRIADMSLAREALELMKKMG